MRVLFVDAGGGVGGSHIVLHDLVHGLVGRGVETVVSFPAPHAWSERFEKTGATIVYERPASPEPGGSGGVRGSGGVGDSDGSGGRGGSGVGGPGGSSGSADSGASSAPPPRSNILTDMGIYRTLSFYRHFRREHAAGLTRWLRRLPELKPDLVDGNNAFPLNFDLYDACYRLGIPFVAHLRGFQPLRAPHRAFRNRLPAGIAISEVIRRHYLEAGFPPERIHRIYDGLAASDYPFREPRIDPPEDGGELLYLGRLVDWKGVPLLLEAFRRLKATRRPALRLVVAGDGPMRGECESFVRRHGLADSVRFEGFVSDIVSRLHAADLMVHTSIRPEPFGRVLLEGMACGTPVVASAHGAAREIIEDGVSGWVSPPGRAAGLAARIETALSAGTVRREVARRARQRVETLFSREQMVDRTLKVMEQVLSAYPAPLRPSGRD